MSSSSNRKITMKDVELARRVFFGGCAFLPLLWIVNVMYYRKQVFGLISWWDKPEDDEEEPEQGKKHIN